METPIYRVSKETTESILNEIAKIVYEQWPDTYQNKEILSLVELKTCQKRYKEGIPQSFYALKDKREVIGVAY